MSTAEPTAGRDILGHPRGLTILFFTEMWERFSFYGMKALLIYHLTRQLMFGQSEALLILELSGAGLCDPGIGWLYCRPLYRVPPRHLAAGWR